MIRKVLILLILVSYVVSDSCVRFTFEDNEWLTHEWRNCKIDPEMPYWIIGKYKHLNLTGQNEQSLSYITPLPALSLSCIQSFTFPMNHDGTIELNIYMKASGSGPSDQINVIGYLIDINGDRVTGLAMDNVNSVSGWQTLRMTLTGPATYDGYISILGRASPDSIVLVDSFRYIPPGMDEAECRLYEDHARGNNSRSSVN